MNLRDIFVSVGCCAAAVCLGSGKPVRADEFQSGNETTSRAPERCAANGAPVEKTAGCERIDGHVRVEFGSRMSNSSGYGRPVSFARRCPPGRRHAVARPSSPARRRIQNGFFSPLKSTPRSRRASAAPRPRTATLRAAKVFGAAPISSRRRGSGITRRLEAADKDASHGVSNDQGLRRAAHAAP